MERSHYVTYVRLITGFPLSANPIQVQQHMRHRDKLEPAVPISAIYQIGRGAWHQCIAGCDFCYSLQIFFFRPSFNHNQNDQLLLYTH